MADYQAQIRLAIQGLSQLQELERRLERATELLGQLQGTSANVGQAAQSAQRNTERARRRMELAGYEREVASRTVRNVAQRRDPATGQIMGGGPNATARRLAAGQLRLAERETREAARNLREQEQNRRLISAAERRYAIAVDQAARNMGGIQGGIETGQSMVGQAMQSIRERSRGNYLTNLFQGRQNEFARGGGGRQLSAELQQQAQNVRAAWDVATAGGQENLRLMQRLATEMSGLIREQNELNRGRTGRSVAFEAGRRGQEKITDLSRLRGAEPAQIKDLRSRATDVIRLANLGDLAGSRQAKRDMEAAISRYKRELEAAAEQLRRQRLNGLSDENLAAVDRQRFAQRQQTLDIYNRDRSLSRDFGVNPAMTLRPAGMSDEQVARRNLISTRTAAAAEQSVFNAFSRQAGEINADMPTLKSIRRNQEKRAAAEAKLAAIAEAEAEVRQALLNRVQGNIDTSRASREASNFGFGLAGDAVAKSIRRNQEKRAAAEAKLAAIAEAEAQARQALLDRVQRNIGLSQASREASNFGFGLGGDAVAKSIRRNQEKRAAAEAKLAAIAEAEAEVRQALLNRIQENIGLSQSSREASNFGLGSAGDPVAKSIRRNREKIAEQTAREALAAAKSANQADAAARTAEFRRTGGLSFEERLARVRPDLAPGGRQQGFFQGNARKAIGEGLIGGAFPLLFGQGLGASAGGAAGGALGGAIGGSFGFGLSLAGTAIGTAVDTTAQNLKTLASSLKSPNEAMAALEASGFRVGDSLKFQVEQLQAVGRGYDAQTLVLQEVQKRLGFGSITELNELDAAQKRLGEQWGAIAAEIQVRLIPVLQGFVEFLGGVAEDIGGFASQSRLQRLDPETFGRLRNQAIKETAKGPFGSFGNKAEYDARLNQLSRQELSRRFAGERSQISLTPQDRFADESARINRARELEDMQRDIQRGELDLIRRKEDIESSIADQRRAESDYEKEIADYRWSVEQRVFQLRSDAIRAQSEVMQSESDVRVARIGLDFEQPIFDARPGLEQDYLQASQNLLQVQEQTETKIARNKIETELRIEDLRREQVDRERQLEREKEQLEQRKDQLLRGRAQVERGIADYQIQVADYQRETARKIFDAWRQISQEMQSAAQGGGVQFNGGGPLGGTKLSQLIGSTESYGGNYGAFNRGGSNNGRTARGSGIDPGLTNMTIAEIQRRQLAQGVPANQQLHAVGKYQIIGPTLRSLLQGNYGSTGVTGSDRFTPEVQEKLGYALARNRVQGRSVEEGMRGLRQEWIGLQNVSDSSLREAVMELQRPGVTTGAAQGPNTRPGIPLNQAAMLNGQAVIWNGRNWESASIPSASAASAAATSTPLSVDLSAPTRPTWQGLPNVPDTAPMQRGMAQSTEKVTQAQERLLELSQELADIDRQQAMNALMRVAQGPNLVRDAEDRLTAERYLADAVGATSEREQERLELVAGQLAETERLEISVAMLKKQNEKLNESYVASGGKIGLSNEQLNQANALLDDQLVKQADANKLNLEALKLQQDRRARLQTDATLRTASVTGAGLRAGLIGSQARALESGLIAGNDADQIRRDVEAAKVLENQQLIWENLERNIVDVSNAISGSLTNGLLDVISGSKELEDVGREFLDGIARSFADSAQQQLSALLQRQIAQFAGPGLANIFGAKDVGALAAAPQVAALGTAAATAAAPVTALGTTAVGATTSIASLGTAAFAAGAALQALAAQAASSGATSGLGSVFSSGAPDLLGSIFGGASPITSAFTGGIGGTAFSAAAPNLLGSFFGGASPLPISFGGFLANGGTTKPNEAYVVGENEPEFFFPGRTGRVVPKSDMEKAAALSQDEDRNEPIEISYTVTEERGERYVTEDQFRKGLAASTKRAQTMAYAGMRNSKEVRDYVGV